MHFHAVAGMVKAVKLGIRTIGRPMSVTQTVCGRNDALRLASCPAKRSTTAAKLPIAHKRPIRQEGLSEDFITVV